MWDDQRAHQWCQHRPPSARAAGRAEKLHRCNVTKPGTGSLSRNHLNAGKTCAVIEHLITLTEHQDEQRTWNKGRCSMQTIWKKKKSLTLVENTFYKSRKDISFPRHTDFGGSSLYWPGYHFGSFNGLSFSYDADSLLRVVKMLQ